MRNLKFMLPLVALAIGVALIESPVYAGGCAPLVVSRPTYTTNTYAYQQYATPLLAAVFVPTPGYTVRLGYDDGEQTKALKELADAVKLMTTQNTQTTQESKLKALENELTRLRANKQHADDQKFPSLQVGQEWGGALLKSKCAKCHEGEASMGGGYSYNFSNLTAQDRKKFIEQIASGKMPKKEKISDNLRMDLLLDCVAP